jgi:hypothetical protein
MTYPKRLIDPDSRSSPRVRALLRVARADVPSEDRIARIEASVGAFLAGAPGGPADVGGSGTGAAGGGVALGGLKAAAVAKIGAAALVTIGVAAGGYAGIGAIRPSPPRTVERMEAKVAPPPLASTVAQLAPALVAPAPGPAPLPSPSAGRSVRVPDGDSEVTLLDAAEAALGSDPGAALSLANRHTARFPYGMLSQEREVIAIEALWRLGRSDEARRRARRFFQDYPRSAHRPRVEALLGNDSSLHNP